MSDADALLAAVLAGPDADLPRLVYADWLEEREEAARAEFIRVQVELAHERGADAERMIELRAREAALLAVHGERWLAPLREPGAPLDGLTASHGMFRRGFVEVVWMPARRFLREADRLFRLAPVRELRVTQATWLDVYELVGSAPFARLAGLDLSDHNLGVIASEMFTRVPAVAGLRVLRLRGCNLTDRAAQGLAAAPKRSRSAASPASLSGLWLTSSSRSGQGNGAAVRFEGA